jgi:rod shape-determining protein MreC
VFSDLSLKVNRERAALVMIPLLVLQIALLSLQIESPSGTLLIKTWVLGAEAPVIAVSSSIASGVRNLWLKYVWMVGARAENERLRQTVHQLSLLNSAYEQAKQENDRLRRLTSLSDSMNYQTIAARVVARTPSFLSNVIYIDRGSRDGIRVNAPVLSGDGIVGKTVLVSGYQSQVQLITNPDASLGAMLKKTRTPGVLSGSGDQLLNLTYIRNTEQIVPGDIVLSSGLDGIFPKGLTIGKVVDSRKGKGVFQSIKVEPNLDLIHIEEVVILLEKRRPEE